MKILHVVNVSFVIPYFLGGQIEYFKKNGHQVFIACSDSNNLSLLSEQLGFDFEVINITREINILSDLISLYKLYKFIYQHKFDVVVGHTPKASMLAMFTSYLNCVPTRIYVRHGIMFETTFGLKRFIFKSIEIITSFFSTKTLCVSKSVFDLSIKMKLSSRNKSIIINNGTCNGVDSHTKFNPYLTDKNILFNLRLKYNIEEGDFVIGFVGRIVQDKGIVQLLKAWDILKLKYKNIKLLLIGPFESRDGIDNNLQNKINNEKSIIYLGLVDDTQFYYKLMNVFILPSYREGFPTVVLEASSMELPVITSKKTGCIDSIIEDETGIFCDLKPDSIVSCIEKYFFDNNLSKTHGQNGRRFVLEKYDQQLIWHSLIKLYCNGN